MILKKSLRARYYIMAKIVTIFLFFSTILSIATPGIGEINDEKSKENIVFHDKIIQTLAETGNSPEDIIRWQKECPTSTLRFLSEMLPDEQEMIASLAKYIRKVNPKIASKTLWREACAFAYYSKKYGVPKELLIAVAKAESHFDPKATSSKGAVGVMQVVWDTHSALLSANGITSKNHLNDPELGIAAGALLLSRYIRAYGSEHKALDRYYGTASVRYKNMINKNMMVLESFL